MERQDVRQVETGGRGLPINAFHEVYQDIFGKMPSGPHWETYLALITLNGAMQRIFRCRRVRRRRRWRRCAPRSSASTTTRTIMPSAQDARLHSRNTTPVPSVAPQVRAALTVRPEIRTFVADYVAKGGAK